jgi:hypothetical protein
VSRHGVSWTERCVYLVALLVTGDVWPAQPTPTSAARDVVAMIDAGTLAALPHRLSEGATHSLSMDALLLDAADIRSTYGSSIRIEPIVDVGDWGAINVVAEHGEWELTVELTEAGQIDHLKMEPAVVRSPPLGLPFRGKWRVGAAGRDRARNHHVDFPPQRRAADLSAVDAAGNQHRGDGTRNEDYFGHGQEILAMADGVVLVAVDGVHENVPGERQEYFTPGNMVFLAHGDGFHSKYSHLIPGSVTVKPGDRVRRGQVLGLCGNSGRSTQPHLHVQGQDQPWTLDAWGIELMFENVGWQWSATARPQLAPEYTFRNGQILWSE